MKKYRRKAEVSVISARDIILQEQIDNLSCQFASFPEMIRESFTSSISSIVQQQVQAMTSDIADIHRISAKKEGSRNKEDQQRNSNFRREERGNHSQQQNSGNSHETRRESNYHQGQTERSFPDHFEFAPDGRPYRCTKYGILGHHTFIDTFICA
jgi:hypothetical protein